MNPVQICQACDNKTTVSSNLIPYTTSAYCTLDLAPQVSTMLSTLQTRIIVFSFGASISISYLNLGSESVLKTMQVFN